MWASKVFIKISNKIEIVDINQLRHLSTFISFYAQYITNNNIKDQYRQAYKQ